MNRKAVCVCPALYPPPLVEMSEILPKRWHVPNTGPLQD